MSGSSTKWSLDTEYHKKLCFQLMEHPGGTIRVLSDGMKVVIGRHRDCELRYKKLGVSRQHCLIEVKGEKVYITDLGSRNGTFVNNVRVKHAEIKNGDSINVGRRKLLHLYESVKPEVTQNINGFETAEAKPLAKPVLVSVDEPGDPTWGQIKNILLKAWIICTIGLLASTFLGMVYLTIKHFQ